MGDRRSPGVARRVRVHVFAACLIAATALGCTVPVAGGLDESDANRIVLALDRVSIDTTKEADPSVEGKFRVLVTRDDAPRAIAAMRSEELPRPHTAGVLEAVDKGALVPSQTQEHAQLVAGLAGDLERTLEGVDGVLAARVHLNVATPNPLRDVAPPKTTASVLLEHRGTTPPIAPDAIARLMAGGVPGLAAADVAVVLVARASAAMPSEAQLSHVGPIAVARSSMRVLQVSLVALTGLVALLGMATLYLYARLRRLRDEVMAANAPPRRA